MVLTVTPEPRLMVVLLLAALNVAVFPVPGTPPDQFPRVAQEPLVAPDHVPLVARAGAAAESMARAASKGRAWFLMKRATCTAGAAAVQMKRPKFTRIRC